MLFCYNNTKVTKRRYKMRKAIVLALCAVFIMVFFPDSSLAINKKALRGQELFTRTNLKVKGNVVFFHNMSKLKKSIPLGTAVTIMGTGRYYEGGRDGSEKIKFKVIESGKKYVLTDLPTVYRKYFVKNLQDIGIDDVSPEVKRNIKNMSIAPGMTKKEVYISKGCPAYIAHGEKSWGYTLDEIMESDAWYYNKDSRAREMIVLFDNGIVTKIIT